jgi:chromosome segregation ATPase
MSQQISSSCTQGNEKEHYNEESLVVPDLALKGTPLEITTHLHERLESIILSLCPDVNQIRNDLTELKKYVDLLKEQLETAERGQDKKITHLEKNQTEIKTKIQNLESNQKDHESKINNLEHRKASLESRLDNLTSDHKSLNERLDSELGEIRTTLEQTKVRSNLKKKIGCEAQNSSSSNLCVPTSHQNTRISLDSDYGSTTNSRDNSRTNLQIESILGAEVDD